MAEMLRRSTDRPHVVSLDMPRPAPAKAAVQNLDIDWRRAVGTAIERSIALVGWIDKEAAAKVGVDPAEFGKWISGERRPHVDRLLAVRELRQPLAMCLAGLADAEIVTEIRFRRQA